MEEIRFRAMGSEIHLVVMGDHRLLDVARRRIDDLERKWSRFIPTSEISRLNANRGEPVAVSDDTFLLVRRALEGWRATGGRFDPTVLGDLVRAGYDRPFEAVVLHADGGVSTLHRNCGAIVAVRWRHGGRRSNRGAPRPQRRALRASVLRAEPGPPEPVRIGSSAFGRRLTRLCRACPRAQATQGQRRRLELGSEALLEALQTP